MGRKERSESYGGRARGGTGYGRKKPLRRRDGGKGKAKNPVARELNQRCRTLIFPLLGPTFDSPSMEPEVSNIRPTTNGQPDSY